MSMLRNIKSGLRSLFRTELIDLELNEEIGSLVGAGPLPRNSIRAIKACDWSSSGA